MGGGPNRSATRASVPPRTALRRSLFEYDAAGYLTGCANEHGRVQRRFDADGRLVEEIQGDFVVRYA